MCCGAFWSSSPHGLPPKLSPKGLRRIPPSFSPHQMALRGLCARFVHKGAHQIFRWGRSAISIVRESSRTPLKGCSPEVPRQVHSLRHRRCRGSVLAPAGDTAKQFWLQGAVAAAHPLAGVPLPPALVEVAAQVRCNRRVGLTPPIPFGWTSWLALLRLLRRVSRGSRFPPRFTGGCRWRCWGVVLFLKCGSYASSSSSRMRCWRATLGLATTFLTASSHDRPGYCQVLHTLRVCERLPPRSGPHSSGQVSLPRPAPLVSRGTRRETPWVQGQ